MAVRSVGLSVELYDQATLRGTLRTGIESSGIALVKSVANIARPIIQPKGAMMSPALPAPPVLRKLPVGRFASESCPNAHSCRRHPGRSDGLGFS